MRKRILPIIAAASIIAGGYGAHMMSAVNHNTKNVKVINHVLLAQSHQIGTVCNLDGYPYLHMRAQGDEYSPIVKDLPSGTQVTVLGEAGGWYNIEVNGVTGWVYSNYLSVNGNVGRQSSNVQSGYANKVGTVCNLDGYPYLHMRSNGTTGAPIIKDLTSGTQVKVLGEAGGWYKIESNGVIGWVYSNYLSVGNGTVSNNQTSSNTSSNTTSGTTTTTGKVGTVCNLDGYPYLHLRAQGDEYSPILKDLPSGTQVNVLGEAGGWYNVEVNGVTGWVYSIYLSVSGQSSNTVSNTQTTYATVGNLDGYPELHIRASATVNSQQIGYLTNGYIVQVLQNMGNGWYKVKCQNGLVGYVDGYYLNF